jgi:hypothetical protein
VRLVGTEICSKLYVLEYTLCYTDLPHTSIFQSVHNIPNETTFKSNCEAFVFDILTANDKTNISLPHNTALQSNHSVLPQGSRIYIQLNNFCGQVDGNCRCSHIRERQGRENSCGPFRLKATSSAKTTRNVGEMLCSWSGSKFVNVLTGVHVCLFV